MVFREVISVRDLPAMVRLDIVSFNRMGLLMFEMLRGGLMGTSEVSTREGPIFIAAGLGDGSFKRLINFRRIATKLILTSRWRNTTTKGNMVSVVLRL